MFLCKMGEQQQQHRQKWGSTKRVEIFFLVILYFKMRRKITLLKTL